MEGVAASGQDRHQFERRPHIHVRLVASTRPKKVERSGGVRHLAEDPAPGAVGALQVGELAFGQQAVLHGAVCEVDEWKNCVVELGHFCAGGARVEECQVVDLDVRVVAAPASMEECGRQASDALQ